ncbi:ionotropic receptor 21a-like [Scylla paramamosain]|uniref:ionotropic receptor 21a-like n=1 Tax=Scylla paramamosain TaxID=85552 RepID=UPI00308378CC
MRTLKNRSTVLETVGMLLGQDSRLLKPERTAVRMVMLIWLILGLVITTGYKSNLIAFLSIPKYPDRPENVEELARANVRSLFLQKSSKFQAYLKESHIPAYRSITSRIDTVTTELEGLQHISEHRKAFFSERYGTMLLIAEHFTAPDGSPRLYVARQNVFPHHSAWIMPHDAPYKPAMDRALRLVIQSGLKEKFMDDMLREAWQEIRLRKKHQKINSEKRNQEEDANNDQSNILPKPLSLSHVQGAFWILLLGILVGGGAFLGELVVTPRRP